MKNSLIGKYVRGTNAYGEAVGKLGIVIAECYNDVDRYGNHTITVEYEDGSRRNTKSFWVTVVEE